METMNSIELLQQAFTHHIKKIFPHITLSDQQLRLQLNIDEAKQEFGNMTTSCAMMMAKEVGKPPRVIATEITANFAHSLVAKIDIAGPGFINIYLTSQAFQTLAAELYEQKAAFFKPDTLERHYHYSLEFVSANPTGPLHFGHGRGAIIGDVLGNILRFVGHTVYKEFYINDAGNQIQKLGESFKIRCMQAAGMDAAIPEDGYHGDYLTTLAQDCFAQYGHELFDKPSSFFADYAKNMMLENIKNTLHDYGIDYDVWFSEKTLHTSGDIPQAIETLARNGYVYEQDNAVWFKATAFGDDKDRVIKKSTGEYTYIAADIAYLKNKIDRGANYLLLVLGHDHHSYVTRLQAVKNGLGYEQIPLDVILYQLVKITENGALVRMSKRAGSGITLQDIIDTVGKDVARFFYLNRKADAQLEFDLELALKKTEENPVYYVQYAYVRTGSILAKAALLEGLTDLTVADANDIGKEEQFLLKKVLFLEQLIADIAINHQTHLLTYYVLELSQLFHRYYSHVRVLDPQDIKKSRARLLMIAIIRSTIGAVLQILGISCPDKM